MKIRRSLEKSWAKAVDSPVNNMTSPGLLDQTWRNLVRGHHVAAAKQHTIEILTDVASCYDCVGFGRLAAILETLGYPMLVLRLSVFSYSMPRVLCFDRGVVAEEIRPERGLAPGSTFAPYEIQGFVFQLLTRAQVSFP